MANSVPAIGKLFPLSQNLFLNADTGFVGIGTITPTKRLTVAGDLALATSGGGLAILAQAGTADLGGQIMLKNGNNVTTAMLDGHGFAGSLSAGHGQILRRSGEFLRSFPAADGVQVELGEPRQRDHSSPRPRAGLGIGSGTRGPGRMPALREQRPTRARPPG